MLYCICTRQLIKSNAHQPFSDTHRQLHLLAGSNFWWWERMGKGKKGDEGVPFDLDPSQKEMVLNFGKALHDDASMKCRVLELKSFIVWPFAERKTINVGMCVANVGLLKILAPYVRDWDGILYVDVMHWILKDVVQKWKARYS